MVSNVKRSVVLYYFFGAVLVFPLSVFASDDEAPRCAEGEYVVGYASGARKHAALQALNSVSDEQVVIAEEAPRIALLATVSSDATLDDEFIEQSPTEDLCNRLRKKRRLALLEARAQGESSTSWPNIECNCNGEITTSASAGDPLFPQLWGLHQSNNVDINAPEAWEYSTGSSDTVVAIIDTGVDYTHPDLDDNMWRNTGEVVGNGVDDDGNGFVDDVYGINAIGRTGNPMDDNGHGTHVAGTIGAEGNNSQGVVGVSWNVKLMGVKFLSSSGSGSLYDAIVAIDYVTMMKNRGVNIVASNNSWGGPSPFSLLQNAIERSRDAGILFVAAAGNEGRNIDSTPSYPASYNVSNIISVGAVSSNGAIANFSNYGISSVDIAAPGVSIASTYPGNQYRYLSGTSMATPHVTGAIALLKSFLPGLTADGLQRALYENAGTLSSLQGYVQAQRFLNVHLMLKNGENYLSRNPPPSTGITPAPATPTPVPTPVVTPTAVPTPIPSFYTVSGSVVNQQGALLAGARVTLKLGSETRFVYTGPDGTFSFDSVLGGTVVTVGATLSGFSFLPYTTTLTGGTSVTLTAVDKSYVLKVKVILPSKEPLSGTLIDAGPFGAGYSDISGLVTFTVPLGAHYTLSATRMGYISNRSEFPGEIFGGNVERTIVMKSK